ncbi:MAG: hypothetical protein QG650_854 [Patescibacteria group bacterium]|nr:hypothetical protein [Patescibacteria group bacterium]
MNAPETPNSLPTDPAYAPVASTPVGTAAPVVSAPVEEPSEEATAEDLLGPPKIDFVSVGLSTLGSLVSGFVGGVIILISTILFLKTAKIASPGIFPYVLALVAFLAIVLSSYLSLFMNSLVFPNKYKEGLATFGQTFAFSILLFILVVPLYVYMGASNIDRIVFVFVIHVLLNSLGVALISEILSNYRYAVLAVYSSFAGFFIATAASVVFFQNSGETDTMIYSLVGVIVVANVLMTFFRLLTELTYYKFYALTGLDPLGDIYSRIEREDLDSVRRAEQELVRFQ